MPCSYKHLFCYSTFLVLRPQRWYLFSQWAGAPTANISRPDIGRGAVNKAWLVFGHIQAHTHSWHVRNDCTTLHRVPWHTTTQVTVVTRFLLMVCLYCIPKRQLPDSQQSKEPKQLHPPRALLRAALLYMTFACTDLHSCEEFIYGLVSKLSHKWDVVRLFFFLLHSTDLPIAFNTFSSLPASNLSLVKLPSLGQYSHILRRQRWSHADTLRESAQFWEKGIFYSVIAWCTTKRLCSLNLRFIKDVQVWSKICISFIPNKITL